jgi:hypothetical protein
MIVTFSPKPSAAVPNCYQLCSSLAVGGASPRHDDIPHPLEPAITAQPLAGFASWCDWVRDPLVALGAADPVLTIAGVRASDEDEEVHGALLRAWHDQHGGDFYDLLKMVTDEKDGISIRKLGARLKHIVGRFYENHRLEKPAKGKHRTSWRVVKLSETT